jgi:hypothetical protein
VATYDGLYPLRLSQACDICDRSLEVIVKEGLIALSFSNLRQKPHSQRSENG